MKKAAIAIDDWKLPIFTKCLKDAGYSFTTCKGLTDDMLILSVKTKSIAGLMPTIKDAQKKSAQYKKNKINKKHPPH